MTLNDNQLAATLLALEDFSKRARSYAGMPDGYTDLSTAAAVAAACCRHVVISIEAVIAIIEQEQKDRENGDA